MSTNTMNGDGRRDPDVSSCYTRFRSFYTGTSYSRQDAHLCLVTGISEGKVCSIFTQDLFFLLGIFCRAELGSTS